MAEDFRAKLLARVTPRSPGQLEAFFAGKGKDTKRALAIVKQYDELKADGGRISVEALRSLLAEEIPSFPSIKQNSLSVWLRSRNDDK